MYATEKLVGDVVAILDSLAIETTNFFGYSFGGGIAFECAKYAPERIKSLIVGGAGARQPSAEMYDELINYFKAGMEAVPRNMNREESYLLRKLICWQSILKQLVLSVRRSCPALP